MHQAQMKAWNGSGSKERMMSTMSKLKWSMEAQMKHEWIRLNWENDEHDEQAQIKHESSNESMKWIRLNGKNDEQMSKY